MNENIAAQIEQYQKSGDLILRNEIVMNNMKLVRACAMSLRNMYIKYGDVDDVVNEGVLALMDAIDTFDPTKGAKFETYASLKIRGAIIDYIRRQDWVPRQVRKFTKSLDKANSSLYNLYNRAPTTKELADHMGMSEERLLKCMSESACTTTLSFEELLYEDNFDTESDDAPTDSRLMKDEMRKIIAEAIENLKEKERQVITLYYYKNMKYSDIAKALGITESRVCQINTKATLALKAALEPYFKGTQTSGKAKPDKTDKAAKSDKSDKAAQTDGEAETTVKTGGTEE
jgi:RNA polymerase sigma factor for flagellar operon FliA